MFVNFTKFAELSTFQDFCRDSPKKRLPHSKTLLQNIYQKVHQKFIGSSFRGAEPEVDATLDLRSAGPRCLRALVLGLVHGPRGVGLRPPPRWIYVLLCMMRRSWQHSPPNFAPAKFAGEFEITGNSRCLVGCQKTRRINNFRNCSQSAVALRETEVEEHA